jgi:hypothetical protein
VFDVIGFASLMVICLAALDVIGFASLVVIYLTVFGVICLAVFMHGFLLVEAQGFL